MTVMTRNSTDGLMPREYDLVPLHPALAAHLPGAYSADRDHQFRDHDQ